MEDKANPEALQNLVNHYVDWLIRSGLVETQGGRNGDPADGFRLDCEPADAGRVVEVAGVEAV